MPKKKPALSAFQLFVSDWKNEHEDEVLASAGSETTVLKQCEDAWKSCPDKQNHYKQLVVQAKGKAKLHVEFKYTCTGETYESKEAERKEAQDFIDNMKLEVKSTINNLSMSSIEALVNYRFYLIHANYYIEWTAEKKFIPCEVAIAEYSVAQGVSDIMHCFLGVDTPNGELPVGYAFEARDQAEKTHQIPPPPFEPAEYDFLELSSRVLKFLTKDSTMPIPPVYTMDDNMNCNYSKSTVCDFMELMRDFSGQVIRVYRLPLLFFELYNACAKFDFGTKTPFVSDINAQAELSVDPYLYVRGIGCQFHNLLASDAQRFCSQSTVQRWAFILSKYCCREVGIEKIPGKHCPLPCNDELPNTGKRSFGRRRGFGNRRGRALSPRKSKIADESDESVFRRPETDLATAPVYKLGKEAGIVSEIRKDESSKIFEETGVRLPKTRGKADMLRSRQKGVEVRGFTKDDFPVLGKAQKQVFQWKSQEPRDLTEDDFPALGGPSRGRGKK